MAAYPSISYTNRSRKRETDTIELVRADNGAAFSYAYGAARASEFDLEHNVIDRAELATLLAFYDANRVASDISFVWKGDNSTHTCLFIAPPEHVPLGGGRYRCVMRLAAV